MKLGKLKKRDLRSQWPHEALHFTRWLAQPENLDLLGDELGIGIKLQQIDASVGKFSVDILAQDENSDRRIIIENQLEQTNHQHLGQLITYAVGSQSPKDLEKVYYMRFNSILNGTTALHIY